MQMRQHSGITFLLTNLVRERSANVETMNKVWAKKGKPYIDDRELHFAWGFWAHKSEK